MIFFQGDVVDDAVSVEQSTAENQQNSSCVEGTCRFTLNDTKEVVQHNNTNGKQYFHFLFVCYVMQSGSEKKLLFHNSSQNKDVKTTLFRSCYDVKTLKITL